MARQHTTLQNLKSILGATVVGLGIVILFQKLDGPAALLANLLGMAAREALELLPSIVPAAWGTLQAYAFDHQQFSPCSLQTLLSLLATAAGYGWCGPAGGYSLG